MGIGVRVSPMFLLMADLLRDRYAVRSCEGQAQFPQFLHRGAIVSWKRHVTPLGQQPNVKVTWKGEGRAEREKGCV